MFSHLTLISCWNIWIYDTTMFLLFFFFRFLILKALIIALWIHFPQRQAVCFVLISLETLGLTAGVVGIYLRNLEKDYKGNDPVGRKILVSSVSGMTHVTSLLYKHNYLTFIYSFSCLSTYLPSVTGNPFTLKSLP